MSSPSTQYTLQLLSEYAYTLDSLPLDLSKNLADMRELDAVLSASIATITNKVNKLVDMIENGTATGNGRGGNEKEEKLWLLENIAREAKGLKLGSDDKIKVAGQTGDMLSYHQAYLLNLLSTAAHYADDPSFSPGALFAKPRYPHLPSQPAVVDPSLETTRRKRAATSRSLLGGGLNPAAVVGGGGNGVVDERRERERERERERDSPTKRRRTGREEEERRRDRDRERNGHGHGHGHSHSRKHLRQPSVDSYVSVTAHPHHVQGQGHGHPQLPSSSTHHHSHSHSHSHREHTHHHRRPVPTAGMLDSFLSRSLPAPPSEEENETNDIDDPDRAYCICGMVSFGEMIACDDDQCEREWFHLSCLGLTTAPKGEKWYCSECTARRAGAAGPMKRSHKKKAQLNGM